VALPAPTRRGEVAALVLTALALAGIQYFVTSGAFTVLPESRLLRRASDDWGHVTYQVGMLKRHPPRLTPVYLLGGSNVRVSLVSEDSLATALRRRTGIPVEVHDFGSNEQNLGETMAIIDNLPRTGGMVVIGVNQTRFSYSPDLLRSAFSGRRIVLLSPALGRFMASHGVGRCHLPILLGGIFAYLASWAQNRRGDLARLRVGALHYQPHPTYHVFPRSMKELDVIEYLRHDGHTRGIFDRYFAFNAALLDATVRLARRRGFTVVLMESPENREIVGSRFDRLKAIYQPFCRALAARDGAHYVNFNDRLGLVNTDFRDLTHLMPRGRPLWQRGLVDALAPLLSSAGTAVVE
jgi:hypothetical protein